MTTGRPRPFTLSKFAISPALARGPSTARARLPGMMCSSTNTSTVTPRRTTTAWTRRRSVYPIMSARALRPHRPLAQPFEKYHSSGLMNP